MILPSHPGRRVATGAAPNAGWSGVAESGWTTRRRLVMELPDRREQRRGGGWDGP
jgi:hypothetical protein